jgi:hypothetical protein
MVCRLRLKRDGTCAETRFRLSPKRTCPFQSAGASVQSTTGSRGVHISDSDAGYTVLRGSVRVLATHSIRQFPLHFPSRASPCAIRFQTHPSALEHTIQDYSSAVRQAAHKPSPQLTFRSHHLTPPPPPSDQPHETQITNDASKDQDSSCFKPFTNLSPVFSPPDCLNYEILNGSPLWAPCSWLDDTPLSKGYW